ncbi:hypothetical protein ACQE3E_21995 [Methylomonas sp. MED-D]|uniref:hypothetical protein n=1 Tax=unclassified Methylomonas TaxID=2608980 RepID=UPI0028A48946|nr:hypothetical protein [Methylomonas sp. MV1]MDT4331884.1 hypothetical protein [Methylomonas sp. MV1]
MSSKRYFNHPLYAFFLISALLSACAANQPEPPAKPIAETATVSEPAVSEPSLPADQKTGPIDVYILPLDDFSDDAAVEVAKIVGREFGIWAKASLPLGALAIQAFPGTRQFAAEDIFEQARAVMRRLPETDPNTHFVFLTNRDINSRTRNFRFQFSHHDRVCRCSVISTARMHQPGDRNANQAAATRLLKMTKRAIGEMDFGWTRSADIKDLMYAPIMSLDDLDAIGDRHPPIPLR